VAAAVLGDAGKIELTPLSARDRFEALSSGKIDLLPRNTTWTLTRDTTLGLNFAGVNYYDGQGFLVPKELGVRSALELNQVTICALNGTTTELNLVDYFRTHRMEYKIVVFDTVQDLIAAYDKRQCDVYTSDQSQLHGQRLKLTNPDDHLVLPEVISKEPLGPVVRHGDDSWLDIVQWSLFCMVNAEELSVTSDNVDQTKADSESPEIRRLLGVEGDIGKALGVSNDWCVNIIKQVGNYGEVFSRHLGTDTPLKIDRGLNALWSRGGLMYAPPAR
jgi:general L-amino acid transport system substrate-binding protein